ncbi:MAG: biotin--[acetyl-CoA-carboxylase] ligase [Clostridia bacterium]|nr:biotin--[acetyl-CoA-carboxylase] ligase [Clostridia bacterium]
MKTKLLEILLNRKYVSGQEISAKLGISRTAVWKHINSLKEDGYSIESQFGRGYRLLHMNKYVTPEKIRLGLKCKLLAGNIIHFHEIGSTNEEAKRLADKEYPEGTLVIAEKQTAGKGRMGRHWQSLSTGLWFSILLKPSIPPRDASQLSLLVAAALWTALSGDFGIKAKIKWPNDLLVDNKKVCGILTEMKGEMDRINYIITGVGINVNQELEDFSGELANTAVSLKIIKGREIDRLLLLQKYLETLEEFYLDFLENGFERARKVCIENSHTIGNIVTIYSGDKEHTGKAVDLGRDGALILKINNQEISFYGGEVSLKGK